MPKFTAQDLKAQGLDVAPFQAFSRNWFPAKGSGVLTTSQIWPEQQLKALDSVQRSMTIGLLRSTGVPTLGGLSEMQFAFLGSVPVIDDLSPIRGALTADLAAGKAPEIAVETAMNLFSKLGFEALQGLGIEQIQAGMRAAVGAVEVVPLIGAMIKLGISYGKTYYEAFKKIDSGSARVAIPTYDPDNDYNAASVINAASVTRDWTGIFSPAHWRQQLVSDKAPRYITAKGWTRTAPHIAGRQGKGETKDYTVFAHWGGTGENMHIEPSTAQHFGFVPLWRGDGGKLWRGVLLDPAKNPTLVGDSLPTTQAMGLALWRAVFNPYSPQIFFVDAVRLGNEWLNYMVLLRRALHLSHHPKGFDFLKGWTNSSKDHASRYAARLWLSFSRVEKGDLKKRIALRAAVCNAMADVFGWPRWNRDDDKMVANIDKVMGVSDEDYIEMFYLNEASPVEACRQLYRRQREAAQSVTAVYSRIDDPAFRNSPELRGYRARSLNALTNAPQKLAVVDLDMVEMDLPGYQAKQLKMPGTKEPPQASPAIKATTYRVQDLWLGDGNAPGAWAGQDPGGTGGGGGGGGGGIAVVGVAAAAAYLLMGRF